MSYRNSKHTDQEIEQKYFSTGLPLSDSLGGGQWGEDWSQENQSVGLLSLILCLQVVYQTE